MDSITRSPVLIFFSYLLLTFFFLNLRPLRAAPPYTGNSTTSSTAYDFSKLEFDDEVAEFPSWGSASARQMLSEADTHQSYRANDFAQLPTYNCRIAGGCFGPGTGIRSSTLRCTIYNRCKHTVS